MNQSRPWKYLLAGTLAGASGAAGLLLAISLALGIGILWQYAYYRNVPVLGDRATTTVLQDVSRLPGFLWGSRWIVVAMVLSGIPLARLDHFAQRYPPPWRDRLAAIALLAVVGAIVIGVLLTQSDQALYGELNVLLVRHTYGRLNWELPGGYAEANESIIATAIREVREETGLHVQAVHTTGTYYDPEHDMHHFVFHCQPLDPAALPQPAANEISDCAFWPATALPRPISDFTIRRIMDAVAGA